MVTFEIAVHEKHDRVVPEAVYVVVLGHANFDPP